MKKFNNTLGRLAILSFSAFLSLSNASAATCAGDNFDAAAYLARYKDLRDAGINANSACGHYASYGKKEGRNGGPNALAACGAGPTITAISNISKSSLTAQFHGEGVYGIDYEISNSSGSVVASGSFAPQNSTPSITYSALANGQYSLLFKGNQCSGQSSKAFAISGGVTTPVPELPAVTTPACKAGPTITAISNISSTGLVAQFHGEEVYGIDYVIKNSLGAVSASGSFEPKSNLPSLSFSTLAAGNYSLTFSGNKCTGTSTKSFSVAGVVIPVPDVPVVVVPPVVTVPACKAGPTIMAISNVSPTGLVAQFDGQEVYGIDYAIKNGSGSVLASGSFEPKNNVPSLTYPTLAAGNYSLTFSGNKCTGTSTKSFSVASVVTPVPDVPVVVVPPVVTTPVCKAGPTITAISNVSPTGLVAQFDGQEVYGIDYAIKNGSGSVLASGSFEPKNNVPSLTYSTLAAGNYSLTFSGSKCTGTSTKSFSVASVVTPVPDIPVVVVPPVVTNPGTGAVNNGTRMIMMNLTGYGFDPNSATGINGDWLQRIERFTKLDHNGTKFNGIDGIEMTIKWPEYEPTEGSFRDDGIIKVLNYCKQKGIKLAILIWPYRINGDGFLPEDEQVTGMHGTKYTHEGQYHLPAYYSTTGRTKLKRMAEHLARVLEPYSNDIVYMTMVYGSALEHTNPIIAKYDPVYRPDEITGYERVNREAFKRYTSSKGYGELDAPVPDSAGLPWSAKDRWNQDMTGKLWYQFITLGLKGVLENFRDGVKAGSNNKIKVGANFADFAGAQSAWYFTYDLKTIFGGMDIAYSSDGTNQWDVGKKILAADGMKGTFPNMMTSIEFDPEDLSWDGSKNYANPIDGNRLLRYGSSFYRRGGNIIHFAMAFSYGETGYDQIQVMADQIWELRKNYIENVPLPLPSVTTTVKFDKIDGDPFSSAWNSLGGSLDKQVIMIQDSSDFWK